MKRYVLLFIIRCAIGLQFRKRSVDPEQQDQEHIARPTLLLTPKELWASGFDARKNAHSIQTKEDVLAWTPLYWTQKTVDAFRKVYDEAMNPALCYQVGKVVVADRTGWGLTSRVRDFQDILIGKAISGGAMVLHRDGGDGCPADSDDKTDPFMRCIFEPFSRCQDQSHVYGSSPGLARLVPVEDNPRGFCESILSTLHQSGLSESDHVGEAPVHYQELGVIRSLLLATTFKFTSRVEERVAELESTLGKPRSPMLVVHVRRTDKVTDSNTIPSWFDLRDGDKSSLMDSLQAILELIKFVESYSGRPYNSIYLIADDPRYFEPEYRDAFRQATKMDAELLYNPYVQESFGDSSKWIKDGHASLAASRKSSLDVELAADMRYAIKYGSHIVGCGRSGISQFIAQGLGAKYMVDPNALTAFEDDALMLGYVLGKKQAARHLEYMSAIWDQHRPASRRPYNHEDLQDENITLDRRLFLP